MTSRSIRHLPALAALATAAALLGGCDSGSGEAAARSLSLLREAGTPHEIRCTVDTELLDADAVRRMAGQLAERDVAHLVLQACRRDGQPVSLPTALHSTASAVLPKVTVRLG